MMKSIKINLLIAIFIFGYSAIYAQKDVLVPFQDEETKLYGYQEEGSLKVRIKPQFTGASLFNCGLAPIANEGKWGCINTKGDIIIPLEFDYIQRFDDDSTAMAKKENNYGVIDKNGKTLIPFEYAGLRGFSSGVCCAKNKQNKWGAINHKNEIVFPFEFEDLSYYPKNGYAIAKKGEFRALLSPEGKQLTDYEFEWTSYLFEERAVGVGKNGKSGILDAKGHWLLPLNDWKIDFDEQGLVQVIQDNKIGFVNEKGKFVIPITYKDAKMCAERGTILLQNTETKWGVFDIYGAMIQSFTWTDLAENFHGKLIAARNANGKWGYINSKGKTVIPFKYDQVTDLDGDKAEGEIKGKTKILTHKDFN